MRYNTVCLTHCNELFWGGFVQLHELKHKVFDKYNCPQKKALKSFVRFNKAHLERFLDEDNN